MLVAKYQIGIAAIDKKLRRPYVPRGARESRTIDRPDPCPIEAVVNRFSHAKGRGNIGRQGDIRISRYKDSIQPSKDSGVPDPGVRAWIIAIIIMVEGNPILAIATYESIIVGVKKSG
jgi:hypothetical protein